MTTIPVRLRSMAAGLAALLALALVCSPVRAESGLLKALKNRVEKGPAGAESRLVYSSDREGERDIWAVSTDGGSPVRLTGGPGLKTDPALSPDTRYVAYAASLDGRQELWQTGIDGSGQRKLTSLNGYVRSPSWSSDGKHLVFSFATEEEPFYPNSIMSYDLSSGMTTTLLKSRKPDDMNVTWFLNYPRLTTDGTWLYHTRAEISTPGFPKYTGLGIYKTNLDSSQTEQVLGGSFFYDETGTLHGHWATTPDICGLDQRLVFVSIVGYTEGAICFSSPDGQQVRRVLRQEGIMYRHPAATLDGRYVFYELDNANGASQIFRYDTVRNESKQLTTKGDNRTPDI